MNPDYSSSAGSALTGETSVSPFLFLRLFLPLALLLAGGAGFYGNQAIERELALLRNQAAANARLGAETLSGKIEFISHDLMFLSRHSALRTAIDLPSPKNLAHLAEDFAVFSGSRGHYDQIRWIGENGLELVRVDYIQGKPVVVSADKLQNKSQRYFFTDTFRLNPGEVFVSPLDLNIEQGKIETPYKPMIRVATPVADQQGRKLGIVILNYYGNDMLQAFTKVTASTTGHSMVINAEGYWLKSSNPSDEWGFMFKRPELGMAARAPAAWGRIRSADQGQVELDDGLWTWNTAYPLQAGQKTSTGAVDAFASSRGELEYRQYFWKTVTHHPAGVLGAMRQATWIKVAWIAGLLLCLAGLGSWLLARAWSSLALAKTRYRTIADFAYDWKTWIDPNGHYVYCSPSCARITGRSADAFIADPNLLLEITHPDDRAHMEKHLGQIEASDESSELTIRILLPDGQIRWLEHACQQVFSETGEFLGRRASNRDITQRKQAEEALRQPEEMLHTLYNSTSDAVMLLDETGFFDCNKAALAMFGCATQEEFCSKHLTDLSPPEQPGSTGSMTLTNQMIAAAMNKESHVFEWLFRRADTGKIFPADVLLNSMVLNGKIVLQATVRDITERKGFEEELKRSNTELEQFSYAVSHDMRQPLRMISSYLQLLERSLAGQLDGEKRDYFNFAIEGAKRIDQMLVALLEYSRVGRMGEPPTWIDSRALLDEALQFLQPALAEAQANLSVAGEWPSILASHDEILRLIQNLIGNAIKYRIAGRIPEITITSQTVNNEWHLCVTYNGIGIIPDQIKRLFQVFQRLQSREAYEGTGIGLALCRKIAEHHKGRIWAESAGEGQGSRFCVMLPVLREKT